MLLSSPLLFPLLLLVTFTSLSSVAVLKPAAATQEVRSKGGVEPTLRQLYGETNASIQLDFLYEAGDLYGPLRFLSSCMETKSLVTRTFGKIGGILCMCDWLILNDWSKSRNGSHQKRKRQTNDFIFWVKNGAPPQHICLENSPSVTPLEKFAHVMHVLPYPFVVVVIGGDYTLPAQRPGARLPLLAILNNPKNQHLFATNLSEDFEKASPLPVGFVHRPGHYEPPDQLLRSLLDRDITPWDKKTVEVLFTDKIRPGGEYSERRQLRKLCQQSKTCLVPQQPDLGSKKSIFIQHVLSSKFVVMAHGGGFDYCPKIFEVMLLGAIPIIKKNPTSDAFLDHPVVILNDYAELFSGNETAMNEKLELWARSLSPVYTNKSLIVSSISTLVSHEYWRSQIQNKLPASISTVSEV